MNEKIIVMMSTYNGEKYLREQIDSILSQEGVDVELLIRDDGSVDNTISIIKEYQQYYKNINFYEGKNLKPAKSFMDLIQKVEETYEYYAFADQDDVWDKNKLISGIEKIKSNDKEIPILSCCDIEFVDENLNTIGRRTNINLEYSNSIEQLAYCFGIIPGCTMVFNRCLLIELKKYIPQTLSMHDKWVHLVCLYRNGIVVKDDKKRVKYRRISNKNVTGKKGFITRLKKLIHFIRTDDKCVYSKQMKELIEKYECKIENEKFKFCYKIANYKQNLKYRIELLLYSDSFLSEREILDLKFRIFLGIF